METESAFLPLPEDIIFNILSRLPAKFLHDQVRFVCQTWSDIIDDPVFIKAQALLSKSGLFFQYTSSKSFARFAQVKEHKIVVKEVGEYSGHEIVGSSAGAVLLRSRSRREILHVANPVTHKILQLPRLPRRSHAVSIAYMPLTGEIKVLCHVRKSRAYKPYVLTVGRNMAWKETGAKRNIPPLSFTCCENSIFSLDGVVYYAGHDFQEGAMKLYANDLANETIHTIDHPDQMGLEFFRIISTGKSLLLIDPRSSAPLNETTAWKLKDFKKSEWVKSGNLKIEENSVFPLFTRVGRMENSDLLFYSSHWQWPETVYYSGIGHDIWIVAYDGRLGEVVDLWKGGQPSLRNFLVHYQTLVSW